MVIEEEVLGDKVFKISIGSLVEKAFRFKKPQVMVDEIFMTSGAMNLQDIGMWNLTIRLSYFEKGTKIQRRYEVPAYRTKEAVTQAVITCVASDIETINQMFKAQVTPWTSA